jgi:hypothetical protein
VSLLDRTDEKTPRERVPQIASPQRFVGREYGIPGRPVTAAKRDNGHPFIR